MSLPIFNTTDRTLSMMQTQWRTQLDPVVSNPIVNGQLLTNITLASGDNNVNHGLQRPIQGWFITRYNGSWAQIYDKQSSNPNPSLYLVLNANAGPTLVDLWVF